MHSLFLFGLVLGMSSCSDFIRPDSTIKIGSSKADIHQAIGSSSCASTGVILDKTKLKFRISAGFERGLCNRIKYVSVDHRRLRPEIITAILKLNSRGVRWVKEFNAKNQEYYTSCDGKYHARVTNDNEIFVVSDALFQRTLRCSKLE
jgi:hypothetical protein